jgi:hypothetical protein
LQRGAGHALSGESGRPKRAAGQDLSQLSLPGRRLPERKSMNGPKTRLQRSRLPRLEWAWCRGNPPTTIYWACQPAVRHTVPAMSSLSSAASSPYAQAFGGTCDKPSFSKGSDWCTFAPWAKVAAGGVDTGWPIRAPRLGVGTVRQIRAAPAQQFHRSVVAHPGYALVHSIRRPPH